MQNSEQLGRQVRLGIEPSTSRLPALSTEPLCHHRWGHISLGGKWLSITFSDEKNEI